LVEHTFGISVVPLSLEQFAGEKVKFIPLSDIPKKSEVSVIWKNDNRNPCLRRVLEALG
jgi:hypothetical protein